METTFNSLGMSLGNLSLLSNAQTRSISAENFDGSKGKAGMATEGTGAIPARELGQGWKVSPSIDIRPREKVTLAEIQGSGVIQHIWLTVHPDKWRRLMVRFFWDDEESPSVEVPLGDFFCNGWGVRCNIVSLPVAVNPAGGFNCYWEMPFRKSARLTLENLSADPVPGFYYQITYALTEIPEDRAYLHAQWRRSNPLPYKSVHTIVDGIRGHGHYVGRQFVEPERKIILVAPGILSIPPASTEFSPLRIPAWHRSSNQTACTEANNDSGCTDGTSWIRFGSEKI
jgi:Protein of unknown function (DUF2961)